MTYEQLRKFLAPLKIKQYKLMPRTANDFLVCYFQWVNVEKRERRVIDDGKHNLNAVNLTGFADKSISDNAADEVIATSINAGYSTDFSEDAAGGLIAATNAGNSTSCADILISNDSVDGLIATDTDAGNLTDCADITVSDDAADGLITTDINSGNLTGCAEDAEGGLIAAIDDDVYMNCADLSISDDAEDGLIATPVNST